MRNGGVGLEMVWGEHHHIVHDGLEASMAMLEVEGVKARVNGILYCRRGCFCEFQ